VILVGGLSLFPFSYSAPRTLVERVANRPCLLWQSAYHARYSQCLCGSTIDRRIGVLAYAARCHYPRQTGEGVVYTDGKMLPPPTGTDFDFGPGPTRLRAKCPLARGAGLCVRWRGLNVGGTKRKLKITPLEGERRLVRAPAISWLHFDERCLDCLEPSSEQPWQHRGFLA
jgi:hypothetical protein